MGKGKGRGGRKVPGQNKAAVSHAVPSEANTEMRSAWMEDFSLWKNSNPSEGGPPSEASTAAFNDQASEASTVAQPNLFGGEGASEASTVARKAHRSAAPSEVSTVYQGQEDSGVGYDNASEVSTVLGGGGGTPKGPRKIVRSWYPLIHDGRLVSNSRAVQAPKSKGKGQTPYGKVSKVQQPGQVSKFQQPGTQAALARLTQGLKETLGPSSNAHAGWLLDGASESGFSDNSGGSEPGTAVMSEPDTATVAATDIGTELATDTDLDDMESVASFGSSLESSVATRTIVPEHAEDDDVESVASFASEDSEKLKGKGGWFTITLGPTQELEVESEDGGDSAFLDDEEEQDTEDEGDLAGGVGGDSGNGLGLFSGLFGDSSGGKGESGLFGDSSGRKGESGLFGDSSGGKGELEADDEDDNGGNGGHGLMDSLFRASRDSGDMEGGDEEPDLIIGDGTVEEKGDLDDDDDDEGKAEEEDYNDRAKEGIEWQLHNLDNTFDLTKVKQETLETRLLLLEELMTTTMQALGRVRTEQKEMGEAEFDKQVKDFWEPLRAAAKATATATRDLRTALQDKNLVSNADLVPPQDVQELLLLIRQRQTDVRIQLDELHWIVDKVHKQTVSSNLTTEQALMDSTKEELLDELARRMGASSSTDAIERLASSVGYVKAARDEDGKVVMPEGGAGAGDNTSTQRGSLTSALKSRPSFSKGEGPGKGKGKKELSKLTKGVKTFVGDLLDLPTGPPEAPTVVTAIAGDGSAKVIVIPPVLPDTGEPNPSVERIEVVSTPGKFRASGRPGEVIVVPGLKNGVRYRFSAHAKNEYGWSPFSDATGEQVPGDLTSPPLPPEIASVASADGEAEINLLPPKPGKHFLKPVTMLEVVSEPDGVMAFGPPGVPLQVKGLRNGMEYRFSARAKNANGWSRPSRPCAPIRITASGSSTNMEQNFFADAPVDFFDVRQENEGLSKEQLQRRAEEEYERELLQQGKTPLEVLLAKARQQRGKTLEEEEMIQKALVPQELTPEEEVELARKEGKRVRFGPSFQLKDEVKVSRDKSVKQMRPLDSLSAADNKFLKRFVGVMAVKGMPVKKHGKTSLTRTTLRMDPLGKCVYWDSKAKIRDQASISMKECTDVRKGEVYSWYRSLTMDQECCVSVISRKKRLDVECYNRDDASLLYAALNVLHSASRPLDDAGNPIEVEESSMEKDVAQG